MAQNDEDCPGEVREAEPSATDDFRFPSMEALGKFATLGGIVLYGALFLAYQTYYSGLGVRPEDVGLSYAYILVRSLGFLAVTSALALLWLGMEALIGQVKRFERRSSKYSKEREDRFRWAGLIVAGVGTVFAWAQLWRITTGGSWNEGFPINWLVLGMLVALTAIVGQAILSLTSVYRVTRMHRKKHFLLMLFLPLVGFPGLALLVGTTVQAHEAAEAAARGQRVTSIRAFGLPWLDVEATPVIVTWIGAPEQLTPPRFDRSGGVRSADRAERRNRVFAGPRRPSSASPDSPACE